MAMKTTLRILTMKILSICENKMFLKKFEFSINFLSMLGFVLVVSNSVK